MPEEIQKHITVKQTCVACQTVFYKKNHLVTLPKNFTVAQIKNQLPQTQSNCPDCLAAVTPKFSFYHEEKLTN